MSNLDKIHKDAVPAFNLTAIAPGDAIIGGHRLECNEALLSMLHKEENNTSIPFPQGKGKKKPDTHTPQRGRFKN